jgi:hypothetical protein
MVGDYNSEAPRTNLQFYSPKEKKLFQRVAPKAKSKMPYRLLVVEFHSLTIAQWNSFMPKEFLERHIRRLKQYFLVGLMSPVV